MLEQKEFSVIRGKGTMEEPQDGSEVDAGGHKILRCIAMEFGYH